MLLAGRTVVVAGYGYCGRGVASRAKGMGADVIVTEINPIRGLEAAMEGYRVDADGGGRAVGRRLHHASPATPRCCAQEHFEVMKDGAIVANSGHFDVEIDIAALEKLADRSAARCAPTPRSSCSPTAAGIVLLANGRLVNLGAAEGHPASVMDMCSPTSRWRRSGSRRTTRGLQPRVYDLRRELDAEVARLKLASMGKTIDTLTPRAGALPVLLRHRHVSNADAGCPELSSRRSCRSASPSPSRGVLLA